MVTKRIILDVNSDLYGAFAKKSKSEKFETPEKYILELMRRSVIKKKRGIKIGKINAARIMTKDNIFSTRGKPFEI